MAIMPIHGKTKYALVDLDLFLHYQGDQVSGSGPSGPLVQLFDGVPWPLANYIIKRA